MRIYMSIKTLWSAFSMPCLILGGIILGHYFFKSKIKESKFFLNIYKFIKVSLCILSILFICIEAAIISYPKYNEKRDDYIIVLGAGLNNGKTPNSILSERLDAAIKIEEENPNQYIVVSGGQGENEEVSEAQAMSEYLQERGIDKDKIILEDKSRNTDENLKFSKEKIEKHSNKSISDISVKIVTTNYHAFRSSLLAKKNGYANFDNYSSTMGGPLIPSTYIREAVAVVKSLVFDK